MSGQGRKSFSISIRKHLRGRAAYFREEYAKKSRRVWDPNTKKFIYHAPKDLPGFIWGVVDENFHDLRGVKREVSKNASCLLVMQNEHDEAYKYFTCRDTVNFTPKNVRFCNFICVGLYIKPQNVSP